MATHFQNSSSFLSLNKDQLEKAHEIIDRVREELKDDPEEGYCGCHAVIQIERLDSRNGVLFYGGLEGINITHVEKIARAIIEELEVNEPFFCSYSYHCSEPVVDEFGGGAFAIMRGRETVWIDAMSYVKDIFHNGPLPEKLNEE